MCTQIELFKTLIILIIWHIFAFLIINVKYYIKTNSKNIHYYSEILHNLIYNTVVILLFRYFLYCHNFFDRYSLIMLSGAGFLGAISFSIDVFVRKLSENNLTEILYILDYIPITLFSSYWFFFKYIYNV